jgi:hypothetical protein
VVGAQSTNCLPDPVLDHTSLLDAVLMQLGLTLVGQGRTVLHMRCVSFFSLHVHHESSFMITVGWWAMRQALKEHLAQSR